METSPDTDPKSFLMNLQSTLAATKAPPTFLDCGDREITIRISQTLQPFVIEQNFLARRLPYFEKRFSAPDFKTSITTELRYPNITVNCWVRFINYLDAYKNRSFLPGSLGLERTPGVDRFPWDGTDSEDADSRDEVRDMHVAGAKPGEEVNEDHVMAMINMAYIGCLFNDAATVHWAHKSLLKYVGPYHKVTLEHLHMAQERLLPTSTVLKFVQEHIGRNTSAETEEFCSREDVDDGDDGDDGEDCQESDSYISAILDAMGKEEYRLSGRDSDDSTDAHLEALLKAMEIEDSHERRVQQWLSTGAT